MMKLDVRQVMMGEEAAVKAARKLFARGLRDCERIIVPATQAFAPVRTGKYKKSIGYVVDEEEIEGTLYSGGKGVPHAGFVEYGAPHTPAYAPMRRGAAASRAAMGQVIVKRMKEPLT